jgi:quinol monooxygenase YgiN
MEDVPMAHATTFKFKALPGKQSEVVALFERWAREDRENAPGVLEYSVIVSNDDPDECMAYVSFDTTENYKKNSDRPGQDEWYRQLRALIQEDPEWFNGTIAMAAVSME